MSRWKSHSPQTASPLQSVAKCTVTELELTPQQSQQTEPSVGRHLARLPGSQLERQPGVSAYPIHESTEGNEAAVGGVSTAGPKALLDVFAD